MKLKISKMMASYLGEEKLRTVGLEWNARSYNDYYELDLANLTMPQITALRGWLEDTVKLNVRGGGVLIRDIDTWVRAMTDAGKQHARTVNQFSSLLTEYLRKVEGHRVYKRLDNEGIAHVCYYVNSVEYHPENRSRDNYTPAYAEMKLLYFELGGRTETAVHFESEDVQGMSASESLAKKGFYTETSELRESYLKEAKRFNEISPLIGKQFIANGTGTDNLDGNSRYSWGSSGKYTLSNTKVVMDVFFEDEKERRSREGYLNQTFWTYRTPKALVVSEESADGMDEDEKTAIRDGVLVSIEVPIHPYCAVFDLRRHLRLRVHVNYLTEYVYDVNMGNKLILPQITKNLVQTLIDQSRCGFADIIEGKGQGVCVLLGGQAGVGKTLTAEVFSEASEKPLYSIQAAQLGIKADQVETNLTKFLVRGSRWGAIVLVDEADVYIRSRDRDMEHNAIVASFLRVIEYQTAIMFMTTNLADEVDDAIISRCIARINYHCPTIEEQQQIWHVLANINNISLKDEDITENVKRHPYLAGRDIKQLLKLATLHVAKHGDEITPDIIDFVAQFQPTISNNEEDAK